VSRARLPLLILLVFLAGALAGILANLAGLGDLASFAIVLGVALLGFLLLTR
jgi:hypothetical protein